MPRTATICACWARSGLDASLQGKADPSDLVRDALLKASLRFGQFQGTGDAELAGWLRQILCRCLADFIRRYRTGGRRAGREQSLDQLLNRSSQVMEHILATNGDFPEAALRRPSNLMASGGREPPDLDTVTQQGADAPRSPISTAMTRAAASTVIAPRDRADSAA